MDSRISSWFLPKPCILSRLRYPPYSSSLFSLLSPIQPCELWLATSFSACSSFIFAIFNFLTRLFVLSGYIASSALNAVILVVLEHLRSTFLAAAICTVSNCYPNFVFPSHTSAHSSLGTITLIRMPVHLLILHVVSRCESVGIASILSTCVLTLSLLRLLYVHPMSRHLTSLRQGTTAGLRSVFHLLPTCI